MPPRPPRPGPPGRPPGPPKPPPGRPPPGPPKPPPPPPPGRPAPAGAPRPPPGPPERGHRGRRRVHPGRPVGRRVDRQDRTAWASSPGWGAACRDVRERRPQALPAGAVRAPAACPDVTRTGCCRAVRHRVAGQVGAPAVGASPLGGRRRRPPRGRLGRFRRLVDNDLGFRLDDGCLLENLGDLGHLWRLGDLRGCIVCRGGLVGLDLGGGLFGGPFCRSRGPTWQPSSRPACAGLRRAPR